MISSVRHHLLLVLLVGVLLIGGSVTLVVALTTQPSNTVRLITTCTTIDGGLEPGLNCSTPNPNQKPPAAQPSHGCWLVDPSEPQWGYNCASPTVPKEGM